MQFPKTRLHDFFSSHPEADESLHHYTLFNNVCYKTSLTSLPQKGSPIFTLEAFEDILVKTREILFELAKILNLMRHVNPSKIVRSALHHFLVLNKGLQIVDELLSNCQEGPTAILKELKQQYIQERPIQAQLAKDVNIKMLKYAYQFLQEDFLPTMLRKLEENVNDQKSDLTLIEELKIRGTQVLMLNLILPSAIDTDLDDLFALPKTHHFWVKIDCITVKKKLGDLDQIKQSFEKFAQTIALGHALVYDSSIYDSKVAKLFSLGLGSLYYSILRSAAEKKAKDHTSQLSVENAYQVMNFVELPGVKHLLKLGLPKIKTNLKFYIDPVVLPIILCDMNKQLKDGTLNQITPSEIEYVNQEINDDHKLLFTKNKSKLRIRLLYNQQVIEQAGLFSYLKSFISKPKLDPIDKMIIHIHGGGFISQSSSSHQCYTREWSIKLGVPIFSIDYSLAPKHPYPIPLDDCWQAYHWILKYSEQLFNIRPNKIVVAGDSAGGNLATALVGLTVKYQCQIPSGLILNYPSVDIRFQFTPSYLKAVNDKVLSHTILGICIESYSAHPDCQLGIDPFVNPLLLSYEILKWFPPVRMFCGTEDPLYDQVFRLGHKLIQLQKDVKITTYEGLTHGYLNFNTIQGMSEIEQCIQDNMEQIRELLN